jgi:hypothetical protein
MRRTDLAGQRQYLWFVLVVVLSIAVWFSSYLLYGHTFISEAGQMLWADWVMARRILFANGTISEWNPYVLFGVDYIGREAFLNPLNLGTLAGDLLPGDKFSFMAVTMAFLALMGLSNYAFLRSIDIRPPFAAIGASVYLLAPKWADDAYHGPKFIVGYAMLPLVLMLVVRMYASRFRNVFQFVAFAVLVSLTYLAIGAPFLLIQAYLVAPFFGYMVYRCWREERHRDPALLARVLGQLAIALVLIVALSAYILFPFTRSYLFAERSLYSDTPGFSWPEYLGLIFPWINRIYGNGVYDLPYSAIPPVFFPNLYFYVGILAVPVLAIGFARRLSTPITLYFAVAFVVWLAMWNRYASAVLPLRWFERLTHGSGSQYQGHIILILSMSVVLSSVLQQMQDRREAIWKGRGGTYLRWLNRILIAGYVAAALTFVVGGLVFGTRLRSLVWVHVTNGRYLFLHYYFQEFVVVFVAMFLIRAVTVWLYHGGHVFTPRGKVWLLILLIADFQLVFRTWLPFTDLDARYSTSRLPNSFIVEQTDLLDRIGAAQYTLAIDASQLGAFTGQPASPDYASLVEQVGKFYDGGYRMPLYEPGFSYFPVMAPRSFYGFHESLMPDYFWDFDRALNDGNTRYTRQSWIGVWDPHSPLLDVAGIKYLFWPGKIEDPRLTELAHYNNHSYVYLNRQAAPRAYLVSRVEYFASRRDLLDRMSRQGFQPRDLATTEDAALSDAMKRVEGPEPVGDARIIAYLPNRVVVAVHSNRQSVLVLSDMYYPNWVARVNGSTATIYRVNAIFRGVLVPAGASSVEFEYRNPAFHAGLVVSGAGWIVASVVLLAGWRNRRADFPRRDPELAAS